MTFKPCPFCGAEPWQIHESPGGLIATWVECTQCGAHTRSVIAGKIEATEAAKKAWNRRPSPKINPEVFKTIPKEKYQKEKRNQPTDGESK
jgi:Lar family restriction alleviation protein